MSILIPYNQLSEEQKGVIRRISRETGNLFVEGPPGSGKTLISLYTISDMVKETNVRPLLMMYNHSLFGFLSSALSSLGIRDNLTIVTKDAFFWQMAKSKGIYPPDQNARYVEKYTYILQNLSEISVEKEHAITIVDEVQDLMPEEWEIIKKMSHRILTLGDFDQGLYKTNLSRDGVKAFGVFEALSKIFRFHKNIAKLAKIFSSSKDDLESKVSIDSQTQPQIIDVKKSLEFEKIAEVLTEIKTYRKRIGIICPDNTRLKQLATYLESAKVDHKHYSDNKELRSHDFTSTTPLLLSSFSAKGLEFEHVILFGFDNSNGFVTRLRSTGKLKSLIYVGITRTNSNLYIIRTEDTIKEIMDLTVEIEDSTSTISIDDLF